MNLQIILSRVSNETRRKTPSNRQSANPLHLITRKISWRLTVPHCRQNLHRSCRGAGFLTTKRMKTVHSQAHAQRKRYMLSTFLTTASAIKQKSEWIIGQKSYFESSERLVAVPRSLPRCFSMLSIDIPICSTGHYRSLVILWSEDYAKIWRSQIPLHFLTSLHKYPSTKWKLDSISIVMKWRKMCTQIRDRRQTF